MNKSDIDDVVVTILQHDGPDGHVDGHEMLTEFVLAVQDNRGEQWAAEYYKQLRQSESNVKPLAST